MEPRRDDAIMRRSPETREETGIQARAGRLLLVDGRWPRNVDFVFEGALVGGTLEGAVGRVAAADWVARSVIAEGSPRLEALLRLIEAGETYLRRS